MKDVLCSPATGIPYNICRDCLAKVSVVTNVCGECGSSKIANSIGKYRENGILKELPNF